MSEEKNKRVNLASGVVIKKDNKYLLVQEGKRKVKGLWNLPAGKVEEETNIEENAVKEAKEETGYDVKIIKKIGVFNKDGEKAVKHAFEAEIVGGELNVPNEEILDAKWFTLDEIKRMKDKVRNIWVIDAIEMLEKENKTDEYLNNWKRCQADFENYKKDQEKGMEEFRKFANMDVILQILPVLDNFNVSLEHVPESEKESAWVTGITLIKKQLEDVLKNNGVEEIEVKEGDKFDPSLHEAITDAKQRTESESTNRIKKIVQRGYKIDGKVIRPARVVVE